MSIVQHPHHTGGNGPLRYRKRDISNILEVSFFDRSALQDMASRVGRAVYFVYGDLCISKNAISTMLK
jgi:hypothetical protein